MPLTGDGAKAASPSRADAAAAPLRHVHLRDGLEVEVGECRTPSSTLSACHPAPAKTSTSSWRCCSRGSCSAPAGASRNESAARVVPTLSGRRVTTRPPGALNQPPPLVVRVDPLDREPRHLQPQRRDRWPPARRRATASTSAARPRPRRRRPRACRRPPGSRAACLPRRARRRHGRRRRSQSGRCICATSRLARSSRRISTSAVVRRSARCQRGTRRQSARQQYRGAGTQLAPSSRREQPTRPPSAGSPRGKLRARQCL